MASDDTAFIFFGAPQVEQAETEEACAIIRSGWLGTGPRVAQFEREFTAYEGIDASRVAAVNSGTAEMHVSMAAAGPKVGLEEITKPLTFCATVNSIIHADQTPMLADVHPVNENIDPAAIDAAIAPVTRAFGELPIGLPAVPAPDTRHAYHLFTIMIDEARCGISRGAFLDPKTAARVGVGAYYMNVPAHPYYQQRDGCWPEQWPNAMRVGSQKVSLPLSSKLRAKNIERPIDAVLEILA